MNTPDQAVDPVGEHVVVADYDPSWPLRFAAESARLAAALSGLAVAIEHVGGTAVPGLPSHPEIDVAVGLPDLVSVAEAVPRLQRIGYRRLPGRDSEGQFFLCRQQSPTRAFALTLGAYDTAPWRRCVSFRDRLRADRSLVREFAVLKRRLAAGGPEDRDAYRRAKAAFVDRVIIGG
jgi:GrpB-like predicted nucleotidyltransferase (UPF0157 family)